MKKITLATLALLISGASSMALATTFGGANPAANNGGFAGGGTHQLINTVRAVLDSPPYFDDMHVTLTGNIVKRLGGEMYLFRDATGEIPVEIDHEDWYGAVATPETTVLIYGEIDNEYNNSMIEVDRIIIQ